MGWPNVKENPISCFIIYLITHILKYLMNNTQLINSYIMIRSTATRQVLYKQLTDTSITHGKSYAKYSCNRLIVSACHVLTHSLLLAVPVGAGSDEQHASQMKRKHSTPLIIPRLTPSLTRSVHIYCSTLTSQICTNVLLYTLE